MNKKILGNRNENKQPIKKISHQDIYHLYELFEQLNSWKNALNMLEGFFSDKTRPVNKKKIVNDYYACSQVFTAFNDDFAQLLPKIEHQLFVLRQKEKI